MVEDACLELGLGGRRWWQAVVAHLMAPSSLLPGSCLQVPPPRAVRGLYAFNATPATYSYCARSFTQAFRQHNTQAIDYPRHSPRHLCLANTRYVSPQTDSIGAQSPPRPPDGLEWPTMSQASKLTLGATSLFALSTVFFVHFQQRAEKAVSTPPCLPYLSRPDRCVLRVPGNARGRRP